MNALGGLPEVQTWRSKTAIFWEPGPVAWRRRKNSQKGANASRFWSSCDAMRWLWLLRFRWPGEELIQAPVIKIGVGCEMNADARDSLGTTLGSKEAEGRPDAVDDFQA